MAEGLKWRVNRAVTHSTLPAFSRLVMLVLAERADARTAVIPDEHTPSLAELADETGMSLASVKRHLDGLESDGWVERVRPSDEERVRGVKTRYRLAVGGGSNGQSTAHPEPSPTAQGEPSDDGEHGSQRAEARSTVSLGTAHSEPRHGSQRAQSTAQGEPSTYIQIIDDLKELTTATADADGGSDGALFPVADSGAAAAAKTDPSERFAEFYKAYPRHKARGRAETAWTKAVKAGAEPQVIIEAAERYAAWAEREHKDVNFLPYPATWLGDRGWEDEDEPSPSRPVRSSAHQPYRNPVNPEKYYLEDD